MSNSLFDRLGGRPTLEKVHKIFYDKIYAHPWIGKYFQHIEQEYIESQQTDFMSMATGGPEVYYGKRPHLAHEHMFITEELFELRSNLLKESLSEAGVSAELAADWFKIDQAFKSKLIKKSPSECVPKYHGDPILDFPKAS
jgi:hemoglobin